MDKAFFFFVITNDTLRGTRDDASCLHQSNQPLLFFFFWTDGSMMDEI